MKHALTPERIEVVRRIAKEGGTRVDVQNALGISKGAARVLVEQCIRDNLIGCVPAKQRQPYRLVPHWSEEREVDWWDKEDVEEQKKPKNKNWFEGWAGAPILGLGKT
jgi:hypothetical protein